MRIMAISMVMVVVASAPALASAERGNWRGMAPAAFEAIDTDGDGMINPDEWRAHLEARRAEGRAAMADRQAARLFERGEVDADGRMDRQELARAIEALAEERGARMRGEGRAERPRRGGEMRHHRQGGRVSPEERAERSFGRMDRDGDGFVSAEEYEGAMQAWAERAERHEARRQARREARSGDGGQD